jgi:hypothetical protein
MTLIGKEKEEILTKEEIESWKSFVDSLSSTEEDRDLFEKMHGYIHP